MAYGTTKDTNNSMVEYARRIFVFYIPLILALTLVGALALKAIG
jgi:hypothetical protein